MQIKLQYKNLEQILCMTLQELKIKKRIKML
jgi:hypothetical protein